MKEAGEEVGLEGWEALIPGEMGSEVWMERGRHPTGRSPAQVSGQSSRGDCHIGHCMTVVSAMLCSDNLLDVIIKHEEEDETYISPLL